MGRTNRPARVCVISYPRSTGGFWVVRRSGGALTLLVGLLVVLSGLALPDLAAAGGKPWRVSTSDAAQVRFSVEDLQAEWQTHAVRDGLLTLYTVDIPGFITSASPGQPKVPTLGGWLVVPPGTRPELRTVREQWQDAGRRPLLPAGVPVLIGDPRDPQSVSVSEELILPGDPLPSAERVPDRVMTALARGIQPSSGSAVTLGQIAMWRGRRIVPVQLEAVQHDGDGLATRILSAGTWEVRFVADKEADRLFSRQGGGGKLTTKNDDRFPGLFLNGEQLRSLPTEAAWHGPILEDAGGQDKLTDKLLDYRGNKAGTLLGPEAKITVSTTRLLRVTYSRLRSEGLLPNLSIQEDQIRLYQRRYLEDFDDGQGAPWVEAEVPIHMVGEGDAFDGDDYFLFYGIRLREDGPFDMVIDGQVVEMPGAGDPFEMNNEVNIYWLAASEPDEGSPWSRMAPQALPAVAEGAIIQPKFRRNEHFETQLVYRENVPYNFTDVLYYTSARTGEATVPIYPMQSPDPAGETPILTASVALFSQPTSTSPAPTLAFSLVRDGSSTTILQSHTPTSTNAQELTFPLLASDVMGSSLDLVMTNADAPGSYVRTFINWVDLSYDALFQVPSGQGNLLFNGGSGGGLPNLVVSGFGSSDLGVVEVTDPRNPVIVNLAPENIVVDGSNWSLSLAVDQTGGTKEFYAAAGWHGTGIREFTYFQAEAVTDPVDPTEVTGPDPDLVVITHPDFRNALEPWLEHRRTRSDGQLNIHVAEVQDIYDWYSGGLRDPWALKRFANHALNQWGTWALVLVGDANENARLKGVINEARPWATDWVPTHYHVQNIGAYLPERLGSDKWFATSGAGWEYPEDYYPNQTWVPTDMYVGRFPCNSGSELSNIISKIVAMETVRPGQNWRRRGIFLADDEWSNDYGSGALAYLRYDADEWAFQRCHEDSIVPWWSGGGPVALDPRPLYLKEFLDPYWNGTIYETRDLDLFRSYCEAGAVPAMKSLLNQGGLVAHYQGHANWYILASETLFIDWNTGNFRQDMDSLNNFDGEGQPMPWVFFGMGCHVSEFVKNTVYTETIPFEQSLGEKFLVRSRAGASATYGSSGYEFILSNEDMAYAFFHRMVLNPPATAVDGVQNTSRWMLGELLWAAEGDILASYGTSWLYTEMCAQFVLLGDPLMILDAGPAQVVARLTDAGDQEIEGTVELPALDSANVRTISLEARDEAGVDRIRILRSRGGLVDDLSFQAATGSLPDGAVNDQIMNYDLEIPIIPCAHEVSVGVYDASGTLDSDHHYELMLQMLATWEFTMGGEPWVDGDYSFPVGELVAVNGTVTLPAHLDENWPFELEGDNLEVTDIVLEVLSGLQLSVAFTGRAPGGTEGSRGIKLIVNNYETPIELEKIGEDPPFEGISKVYNFPNPMQQETRFLFQSGFTATSGIIRVFSTAGRPVARIPFRIGEAGPVVVPWDGRDPEGDILANGVYLYRIELDTPAERTVSNMQRLVMMR